MTYDGPSRTATLNPSADLAANTTYTARLTGAITDTAAHAQCPGPGELDVHHGARRRHHPADGLQPDAAGRGATESAVGTNVTATFSEPVTGVRARASPWRARARPRSARS